MFINFSCPPLPFLVVGGLSLFRRGDLHEKRVLHKVFDLIFVDAGELFMQERTKWFTIKAGQFLILPPEREHGGAQICKVDTRFYWIHFWAHEQKNAYYFSDHVPKQKISKMNKNKYYHKGSFVLSLPQYGTLNNKDILLMREYMKEIMEVTINKYAKAKLFLAPQRPQIVYQKLFIAILALISCQSKDEETTDLATDVYQFLRDHYHEPITLKVLSEKLSYSRGHMIRQVKLKYGITPMQLLKKIRLDKAKELLTHSEDTIEKVSEKTGFKNQAYFGKVFKKEEFCSPSKYRKIHRK